MEQVSGHGVVLRPRHTPFIGLLRKTPARTVCPNFYLLAHANGCTLSPQCSYCYLKSSLWHVQGQHAFTNLEDLQRELDEWLAQDNLESCVLNTGNLSDSLLFEQHRPLVGMLVETFRRAAAAGRPHRVLLVTKGGVAACAPLRELAPCDRVIVSFSVNAPAAAARHERGAPPTADRLAAARQLQELGWRLRLRLDPMIAGFEYEPLARDMYALRPERITLGCLRVEPNLERRLSKDLMAGLERCPDGGLARYPLAKRLELYRRVAALLGDIPLALCEETTDVWQALGLDTEHPLCNCAL